MNSGSSDQQKKFLRIMLALQVAVALWAGLVFKIFDSRFVAGMMASSAFNLLGLGNLMCGLRFAWYRKSLSFYAGLLVWFAFILPMFLMRLAHPQLPIGELQFLWMNGSQFHSVSSYFYLGMMVITAGERWRLVYQTKTSALQSP